MRIVDRLLNRDFMKKYIGRTYGRLTIVSTFKNTNGIFKCHCICSCGGNSTPFLHSLTSGSTKSCGCIQKEVAKEMMTTHGMYKSAEYATYSHMITRCYSANYKRFNDYGGRGIFVCRRWRRSFESFYKDIGERPSKKHSIDRIDNNGPYAPWNCKWSTRKEQCRNTRKNVFLTYNGENKTIAEWSELLKINDSTLRKRIARGWSIERAINTKVNK